MLIAFSDYYAQNYTGMIGGSLSAGLVMSY